MQRAKCFQSATCLLLSFLCKLPHSSISLPPTASITSFLVTWEQMFALPQTTPQYSLIMLVVHRKGRNVPTNCFIASPSRLNTEQEADVVYRLSSCLFYLLQGLTLGLRVELRVYRYFSKNDFIHVPCHFINYN